MWVRSTLSFNVLILINFILYSLIGGWLKGASDQRFWESVLYLGLGETNFHLVNFFLVIFVEVEISCTLFLFFLFAVEREGFCPNISLSKYDVVNYIVLLGLKHSYTHVHHSCLLFWSSFNLITITISCFWLHWFKIIKI